MKPLTTPVRPVRRPSGHWRHRLALIALVGTSTSVLTVAPGVAPAHAAFPGQNGRIAYVNTLFNQSEDGSNQIFTVRPNGTGKRQLTYRGESDSPDWGPYGRRIVYRHFPKSARVGIWVMRADGRHKRPLIPGSRRDRDSDPAWSPDGRRIVFTRASRGAGADLMVYTLRTNSMRALYVGRGRSLIPAAPAWSPDGRTIVFSVVDISDPTAVDFQTDLFTVRADGTHLTQITRTPKLSEGAPDWSPGGQRLLYARARHDGGCEQQVITSNPDGTVRRRVRAGCLASMPAWAPNGRRILTYAVLGRRSGVWAMSPTGANRRYVASGLDGHWQPLR
jgi:Tol biopolymer transport system component